MYRNCRFSPTLRVEEVVDVFVRVGDVFRIFRNHERIQPSPYAFFGHHHADFLLAARFFVTGFWRCSNLPPKVDCYAGIASALNHR